MPSTSLKNLYIGKSVKDLEERVNNAIPVDLHKKPTTALIKLALSVFKAAETSDVEKDEEKAYVQYMRYIDLLLKIKNKADFAQNPDRKCVTLNAGTALLRAEILKESLLKRYSSLEESTLRQKNEKNDILSELHKKMPDLNEVGDISSMCALKIEDPEALSITSSILRSLMTEQANIIIMDVRPANDFEESHIKHSRCISVPQEILNLGVTALRLESMLPKESLSQWYRRGEADHVILLDWNSKDETSESVHLMALKQAMCKWDQKCTLKKPPLILLGGYKDWMSKFPMYTTKPLSFESINDVNNYPRIADVSAIEYPSLDENTSEKVSSNKENLNYSDLLFKTEQIINNSTATDLRKAKSAPTVDRKSKPNVDRGLKSSGVERKLNVTSGSDQENRTASSHQNKPIPPNCILKPTSPSLSSNSEKKPNSVRALENSLKKEEALAREQLELAKQQLKNEEEFEKLRLRKELEAEESKCKEIQKQEEKLHEKLRELQRESTEKDAAYLLIKEENIKMKKMLAEQKGIEFQKKGEAEIAEAMKNKKALLEDVARLREERKKKEALAALPKNSALAPRESVSANTGLKRTANPDSSTNSNANTYTQPLSRQNSSDSSRGLARSHSSPNIAQMVNQEEKAKGKLPVVDRSLKPKTLTSYQPESSLRARMRNFNLVYGNCPARPATGLRNLGNTCFMNSIIQCLSNTIPLAEYINSNQYMNDINRSSHQGSGGELTEEFAVVIKHLWMGQYKSISPKDFKNTVSKVLSVCIGNEQQDSHEFLVVLMEKLHADLNKKSMKPPKLESTVDENRFWHHYKSYNCSKISDIFEGLLKSTLTCLSCHKTSDSFEVFSCLSLPILSSRCSLRDCFQHFLKPEKISGEAAWDCPRCKQKKEAEKRLRICRLPQILVIQLKRFSYEGLWRRKLQTTVDFDLGFDVPCEENLEERYRSYGLYGVVNHYGTLEGGHYTAYCKSESRNWYRYDDHEVSEISISDIKTPAAYLLFYQAMDFQSHL